MATNFAVILFQRQHFGNEPSIFSDIEPNVPFAGSTKDFSFDCPGVNPSETAFLMFQSRDVDDIDDFIIDNVVIVYKIPEFSWTLPAATGDFAAFLNKELLPSIPNVRGSGRDANPADQHNQYVLPTASQLAVFQSLLAGALGPAHRLARMISSTYNVVLALGARTLLIAGADRDQNTAEATCEQSNRRYLEADVSHTAESVFQIAFEEIYSSDASTWHLQFHGNANATLACQDVDVFLTKQRRRGRASHALCAQREHRCSLEGRGGRRARPRG